MTYAEVNSLIESIGIPSAYYQFTADTAVPPPFICFYFEYDTDLYADNRNYQKVARLMIEVYTDEKDFDLEARVEAALNDADIAYVRSEMPIESERLYLVTFETSIIITEEANENG